MTTVKIKPKDFDFRKWGPIIEPKTMMDLSNTAIILAAIDCSKHSGEDMFPIIIITKYLKYWSDWDFPLMLLDFDLKNDESYILCQNLDGTKKLIWHSTGV